MQANSINELFPIQQQTFSSIEKGESIIARDKTGSGKTLAYVLPLLQYYRANDYFQKLKNKMPCLFVIVPTRELCI